MISDCCLNNILGLSKVGRLSISLSDIFLTSTGLGDIGLSVLRLKGDIRNSLSFLSSLDRGANGGRPKGVRRLFPGIKVGFVLSLMSEACWSLSVLRSSSSLSTLVSTRSRFLVFSSDVRSSWGMTINVGNNFIWKYYLLIPLTTSDARSGVQFPLLPL